MHRANRFALLTALLISSSLRAGDWGLSCDNTIGGPCVSVPSGMYLEHGYGPQKPPVFWPMPEAPGTGGPRGNPGSANFQTPPSIFFSPSANPAIRSHYHRSMVGKLFNPGAPETQHSFQALDEAIRKFGSAEEAIKGIPAESAAALKTEVGAFLQATQNQRLATSPFISFAAVAGVTPPAIKELTPLKTAAEHRDPLELAQAISNLMDRAATGHPKYRSFWTGAMTGTFTDGDWQMLTSGDAPSLVRFKTAWTTPKGRELRASYNKVMASQFLLQSAYRTACEQTPEACGGLRDKFEQAREDFVLASFAHGVADKLASMPEQSGLYRELVSALDYYGEYMGGTWQGLKQANLKLAVALEQLAFHPIDSLAAMGPLICESLVHIDRVVLSAYEHLDKNMRTYLWGAPRDRGKVLGAFGYDVAVTLLVPGSPGLKTAEKSLVQVSERTLTRIASEAVLKEGAEALGKTAVQGSLNLVKVFPETAAVTLQNPAVLKELEKLALKDVTAQTIARAGAHDLAVKSFVQRGPGVLIDSIGQLGYEAVAHGSTGLLKLERVAPKFAVEVIGGPSRGSFFLGRNFANRSDDFIQKFVAYAEREKFTQGKIAVVSEHMDGMSSFMTAHQYELYVEKGGRLGRADGYYVLTRAAADKLVAEGGQSAAYFEKKLSLPSGSLLRERLVRVDTDFALDLNPRVPSGLETAANEFFLYGGTSRGGIPEIVVDSMPKSRIKKVTPIAAGMPLK